MFALFWLVDDCGKSLRIVGEQSRSSFLMVLQNTTLGVADLAVVWGLVDEVMLGLIGVILKLEVLVVRIAIIVVIVLGVKLGNGVMVECPRPERPTIAADRHYLQAWRCVLRHCNG